MNTGPARPMRWGAVNQVQTPPSIEQVTKDMQYCICRGRICESIERHDSTCVTRSLLIMYFVPDTILHQADQSLHRTGHTPTPIREFTTFHHDDESNAQVYCYCRIHTLVHWCNVTHTHTDSMSHTHTLVYISTVSRQHSLASRVAIMDWTPSPSHLYSLHQ